MEKREIEYFDLTVFLKQNVLNLREITVVYRDSVDNYLEHLTNIRKLIPDVKNALEAFAKIEGDKTAYKSIDNMVKLLKEIKCEQLVSDFFALLGAYEHGNWRLAATIAEKMIAPFEEFSQTIEAARKTKKPADAPDTALSLRAFIRCLDEAEATRKMVILAIDDSPSVLTALSYVLENEYKVFTLLKPLELEKVLQKLTPDLFLLDCQMPERNGFELVPVIRNFKEHKDTPIIYLTSIGTIDAVTSALALGACDFIVKPFDTDILLEKIGKWIVRKKLF